VYKTVYDLCFTFTRFLCLCAGLETRRIPINRNIINSRGFKVITVTQFMIEIMFNAFMPIVRMMKSKVDVSLCERSTIRSAEIVYKRFVY
jgi:hypothetical protein